jgi:hypothetical protein
VPQDSTVDSQKLVARINPVNSTIFPGVSNKSLKGSVGGRANAVAIGVAGDVVYWRLPALSEESTDPGTFDFTASFSISREVAASSLLQANADGTWTLPLSARAVDNAGNFGPATIQPLVLESRRDCRNPHRVAAMGYADGLGFACSGSGEQCRWLRRGLVQASQLGPRKHHRQDLPDGTLDYDSNAGCQIDGRNLENVIWKGPPPAGHYVVRVAAASLCGLTSAAWHAYASASGVSKGAASGVLTDAAARSSAEAGSGVTAFEFDYP